MRSLTELITEYEHLIERFKEADKQSYTMDRMFIILLSFFENLPLPAWIKATTTSGEIIMLRVNQRYASHFGKSNDECVTLDDVAIWGNDPAVTAYGDNDRQVVEQGKAFEFSEMVRNPITGKDEVWRVTKWPIMDDDNEIMAVCGLAIYMEE